MTTEERTARLARELRNAAVAIPALRVRCDTLISKADRIVAELDALAEHHPPILDPVLGDPRDTSIGSAR